MPNKSSAELAGYMASRLTRRDTSERTQEKAGRKAEEISPRGIDERARELIDLTLEKEDLINQIASDRRLLKNGGKKEKRPSANDVLAMFNEPESIDFRKLNKDFTSDQGVEHSLEEADEKLGETKIKIAELAKDKQVLAVYKESLKERIDVIKLARQVEAARQFAQNMDFAMSKLLAHRNNEDVKLTKADHKVEEKYAQMKEKTLQAIEQMMSVPEVYHEVNRRELLNYRVQLAKGGIVETPSVKKEINEVLGHLQIGIPVFLRGHLGAGKTEVLLHISRKYYGVEPEFISGSEEATKYDIYGKTQIGARPEEDRSNEFKMRMEEFKEMNPDVVGKELKKIEKEYYDEIVVKGQTTSFFQYGPLVRAMKEGKPLIIDEIDGIPHSILMRLNHILTRKVGDKVKIQENGGEEIEIKPGFCVMATANIKSAKYKREELDAAFLSRWWSSEIKYLPVNETLQIIAASLIDKRANLELPRPQDFDALRRLAQAAEEIQNIFSGEKSDVKGYGGDAVRNIGANLEKSTLSMRDLWNIIRTWKARNFDKPLDDYIYSEFIKKATVPKDAIYLAQIFCRFRFFSGWTADKFGIPGLSDDKLKAFQVAI